MTAATPVTDQGNEEVNPAIVTTSTNKRRRRNRRKVTGTTVPRNVLVRKVKKRIKIAKEPENKNRDLRVKENKRSTKDPVPVRPGDGDLVILIYM